jgi:hypothetical protein
MTAQRWLKQSREAAKSAPDTPSVFRFEYPPGSGNIDWYHIHHRSLMQATVSEILDGALTRARDGVFTVSKFQGQTVYQRNPKHWPASIPKELRDADDETLMICGYEPRLIYDADGNPMPEVEWRAPPNELVIATLSSYERRWSKKVTVDHNHQVGGSVVVAHSLGSMPRKALERAAPPMLEVIAEPAVMNEIVETTMVEEPPGADEPEAAEPAPAVAPAPTPSPRDGLSDLQRDLLARAREKNAL